MGGMIAQHAALAPSAAACARWRCSTRARPSASTAPIPRPGSGAPRRARRRRRRPRAWPSRVLRSIMAPGVDDEARRRRPSRRWRASRPTACAPPSSACRRTTCATASARSRVPTLVLVGEHDEETPPVVRRGARRRHPRARGCRVVPGAGHLANARGAGGGQRRCCASISAPSEQRDDRVALAPGLRASSCAPCALQPRRGRGRALGVGQPPRAGRDGAARRADAGRPGRRRRRARRPPTRSPVPIRSTGASQALAGNRAAIAALAAADLVIDCTVEGLLHAPELGAILGGGARVLMISQRAPRELRALRRRPDAGRAASSAASRCSRRPREMRVTSAAGTDLTVAARRAPFRAGSTGRRDRARARSPTGRAASASRSRPRTASTAPSCSRPATSTSRSSATSASR